MSSICSTKISTITVDIFFMNDLVVGSPLSPELSWFESPLESAIPLRFVRRLIGTGVLRSQTVISLLLKQPSNEGDNDCLARATAVDKSVTTLRISSRVIGRRFEFWVLNRIGYSALWVRYVKPKIPLDERKARMYCRWLSLTSWGKWDILKVIESMQYKNIPPPLLESNRRRLWVFEDFKII